MKKFICATSAFEEIHYINPDNIAKIYTRLLCGRKSTAYFIDVDIGGKITSYEISFEDYTNLVNLER